MQLRLAFSVPKFTGSVFNQTTSAILTGVTIAGAFSTVIFNSTKARTRVTEAFQTFAKLLSDTPIYSGVEKITGTFKQWGTTIVATKDDFREWVDKYLNPSGLKSGAVALYEKLRDWAQIVYDWFVTKFIKFIENIPKMVENWKSLRLSLFKWGTFLGGGGGSALFAMFGNGDNWDKLGELLGNPEFAEVVDKFSTLLSENSTAFSEMSKEEAQEILEAIMDDPKEAKGIVEELLKDQDKKNEEKQKEQESKSEEENKDTKKEELKREEIVEKFKKSGGGSPKSTEEAFGHMVSGALQGVINAWDQDLSQVAKSKMKNYLQNIRDEVTKKSRKWEVKQKFLEALGNEEDKFLDELGKAAKEAYQKALKGREALNYKILAEKFGEVLENKFTVQASGGEEGTADIRKAIPVQPLK